jgi:hypothetical protein
MTVLDGMTDDTGTQWSIGGAFLEALANRDYRRMASTLGDSVQFRAMLPPGPKDWHGPDAVTEAFRSWFGAATEFEVVDATVGQVGHRLHLSWRIHLRPAPFGIGQGWYTIEQQAYADASQTIEILDLVCSGFQPDTPWSTFGGGA